MPKLPVMPEARFLACIPLFIGKFSSLLKAEQNYPSTRRTADLSAITRILMKTNDGGGGAGRKKLMRIRQSHS